MVNKYVIDRKSTEMKLKSLATNDTLDSIFMDDHISMTTQAFLVHICLIFHQI